ncbi:hypothetical protein Salat_2610500 [Sesamum alatum]|uniref:Retrotransposon Copia-like N-terminal domain-containing protein n=1 Tax=Sesamum alatum TaxID=300844 RepID=A0AAE1XP35_9LAMI|nr:hypothetical protein Salat_2610500 [Sesamum alatum]
MGFIDGTSMKPNKEDDQYDKWVRADSMIQSWILNVISKEMVGAFMYTKMARELWVRLEERFSESNGRLVYKIQREIASISQGSQSVVVADPMPSVNKEYKMVVRVEKQRFCYHGGQTGRAQA